jgi:hypothetical protein
MTDPQLRPFVCRGNPLECPVFIVGFNATTGLPFRSYWDAMHGFDKDRFIVDYLAKKNLQRPVGTRARLDIIARHLRCLETNLFSAPTRSKSGLKAAARTTEIFHFLFAAVRPRLVWVHGADAYKFFSKATGRDDFQGQAQPATLNGHRFHLFGSPHLSRGVTYDQAAEWALELKALLGEEAPQVTS